MLRPLAALAAVLPAALAAVLPAALAAILLAAAPAAADPGPMASWSDADIAGRVLPAVVNITVEKIVKDPGGSGMGRRETFFGSGFVIDPSGLIVTNRHVIEDAIWITVGFADRSQAAAELIAACGLTDVALLKTDAGHPLPALKFADSDQARIGDPVLAAGNPLGIGTSVSAGIVSALNRDIMTSPFDQDIQTDAAINHGNSGGPLVDRDGAVIGLNTALTALTANGGSIGIGYAIPSNEVAYVVHALLDPNASQPGWIGLHLQDVTSDLAQSFGLPARRGLIVTGSDAGSPAQAAGLRSGDIVLRYGDMAPADSRALMREVTQTPLGRTVPLTVWRDGQQREVPVTVAAWPGMVIERGAMMASAGSAEQARPASLGLDLGPVTESARKQYQLAAAEGVLVTGVETDAEAFNRGVTPGDVILKVQNTPVGSPAQVQSLVEQAREKRRIVALLVSGKGGARWVSLYFGAAAPPSSTRGLNASAGPESPAAPAQGAPTPSR